MNYVKLNDGVLSYMPRPKHISNPSDEQLTLYAADNGWLELRTTTPTSAYHTMSYRAYSTYVTTVWTKPSLDALKTSKKSEADSLKESALATTQAIDVDGLGGVIYNQDALINIMGVLVAETPETDYVLADDSVSTLTLEQMLRLAETLSNYRANIYALKAYRYNLIDSCESVDDLLALDVSTITLPTTEQ